MTLRRLFVGMTMVFGLSVWAWVRADGDTAQAAPADPVCATADAGDGGNHDDAAYRFRTSQSRHWRHVMIGGR